MLLIITSFNWKQCKNTQSFHEFYINNNNKSLMRDRLTSGLSGSIIKGFRAKNDRASVCNKQRLLGTTMLKAAVASHDTRNSLPCYHRNVSYGKRVAIFLREGDGNS